MSAIARLTLTASGRNTLLRLAQPSAAAVRTFQTSQANKDIDSGKSDILLFNFTVLKVGFTYWSI